MDSDTYCAEHMNVLSNPSLDLRGRDKPKQEVSVVSTVVCAWKGARKHLKAHILYINYANNNLI